MPAGDTVAPQLAWLIEPLAAQGLAGASCRNRASRGASGCPVLVLRVQAAGAGGKAGPPWRGISLRGGAETITKDVLLL